MSWEHMGPVPHYILHMRARVGTNGEVFQVFPSRAFRHEKRSRVLPAPFWCGIRMARKRASRPQLTS